LWPGWLASGKLAILAGAPGTGKTTLAMALAAILSRGSDWPDGSPGGVLIWSGEDDPNDTLAPRLQAAGADRERVHFVTGVNEGGGSRGFDPAIDMPRITPLLEALEISLLIIDPIVSAVRGDSHKANEVRRSLQPIVDQAMQQQCAVLGITHFSKGSGGGNPLDRVIGSQAFGALARVVLVAARDEQRAGGRVLARAKSNIGPDDGGIAYQLDTTSVHPGISTGVVRWGERLRGSAREIMGEVEGESEELATAKAASFLREALANGPVARPVLEEAAAAAGITWSSVRRIKGALGVIAAKSGMKGGWEWSLPVIRH
jgi:putative DNA primase/helicase